MNRFLSVLYKKFLLNFLQLQAQQQQRMNLVQDWLLLLACVFVVDVAFGCLRNKQTNYSYKPTDRAGMMVRTRGRARETMMDIVPLNADTWKQKMTFH